MDSTDWIIAKCYSDGVGINLYRFFGTANETKERIAKLMEEDVGAFPRKLDYTSSIADLTGGRNDDLCAAAVFEDFHIIYTARKLNTLYIF